jgi:uracil-DNA glycosylase
MSEAFPAIPASWASVLAAETSKPYFAQLEQFVAEQRQAHTVYPPAPLVFSALELTPYEQVRVFILGQDPYHGANQAHGLAFSVQPGIRTPPSLVNMYKEFKSDIGGEIPKHGCLVPWAEQGVLLLNAVLTVREAEPNSHKSKGWEKFTDAVIKAVNDKPEHVVFMLWGGYAQKKAKLIDTTRHTVLQAAHPSPLSAHNGFFGSKPYSQINAALEAHGQAPINWQLPLEYTLKV